MLVPDTLRLALLLMALSACTRDESKPPALPLAPPETGAPREGTGSHPEKAGTPPARAASPTPPSVASPRARQDTHQAVATFYDARRMGACSLEPDPKERDVAAVGRGLYRQGAACGTCIEVEGPKGKVRVRIVDLCPGCKAGKMDLSREAFSQVATPSAGRVQVRWRPVPCELEGPLRYRFKEGSSKWWVAVQVRNHRLPVARLESWRDGRWREARRTNYNDFVLNGAPGDGPLRLRVTAQDGQVREDTLPAIRAGQVLDGQAQFDSGSQPRPEVESP